MASTRGRRVEVPLTNKSGGGVIAGDVVIIDTTNDDAFTTTTTGQYTGTVGIAQETIANNGIGRVLIFGEAALVNVPASVTRGHFIETHTVAKQATGSSSRRNGSFGQFKTGGTTPKAIIGLLPSSAGSGAVAVAASSVAGDGLGDFTTSSTSFVDLTGASITLSTGARRVKLGFTCVALNSGTNITSMTFSVAGSDIAGAALGIARYQQTANNIAGIISATYMTAAQSAGSNTFKVRILCSAGTTTIKNASASAVWQFWAEEVPS